MCGHTIASVEERPGFGVRERGPKLGQKRLEALRSSLIWMPIGGSLGALVVFRHSLVPDVSYAIDDAANPS
jgi:hypothetical protein